MENPTPLHQNIDDAVSPNSVMRREALEPARWFLMRAAYGQEKKASEYLRDKEGIDEIFLPQWLKERSVNGKMRRVMVSIMPNTLFVKSTLTVLHQYIGVPPLTYFHHYYQRTHSDTGYGVGTGRKPIVVPDSQMLSFQRWLAADAEDKIFIDSTFEFKKDDVVRVTEGEFKGFTGHVVRLKGQTRVGINIEGFGFISTTYIPKHCLEIITVSPHDLPLQGRR